MGFRFLPPYLNKGGLQWIFTDLEGVNYPLQVYEHVVVQRKTRGDADALVLKELVKKGILHIVQVENGFIAALKSMEAGLHQGELEVLALAKKGGTAILDERIAREGGHIFGIDIHGTLFLIFLMVKKGTLKRESKI